MDKFSFIGLWDVYSGLLTGTRREITNLYFNFDLTVSEIAAEKGISRQAVSECLKDCKAWLEELEMRLHIFERLQTESLSHSFMLTDASKWADEFKAVHPEYGAELERLSAIIAKDYSREVEKALSGECAAKLYERKKIVEE